MEGVSALGPREGEGGGMRGVGAVDATTEA